MSEPVVQAPLAEVLQRIEDRQEEQGKILTRMDERLEQVIKAKDDHESRIRALERKVWAASGIAAVAGAGLLEGLQQILK